MAERDKLARVPLMGLATRDKKHSPANKNGTKMLGKEATDNDN